MEKYICGDILKESEYLLNTIKTSKNMEGSSAALWWMKRFLHG